MSETAQACQTCGRDPRLEVNVTVALATATTSIFALYLILKPAFVLAGFALAWPQIKIMAALDLIGPKGMAALQLIEDTLAFRLDAGRIPFEVLTSILGNTPMFSPLGMATFAVTAAFLVHRRKRSNASVR